MGANFWIDQISAIRTGCRLTTDDSDGHGWRMVYHETHEKHEKRKGRVARVPSGATSDMARMIANGRPRDRAKEYGRVWE